MGIPKKFKKWLFVGVAALIAVPVLTHNPVYYRLYPGNRITANIQIFVDGEKYEINKGDIQFTDQLDHNGKVSVDFRNVAKVKYRANKKSRYTFDIVGTPVNHPISIGFSKANWWDMHKTDIIIDIDTSAETLTLRSDDTKIANNEIFRYNTQRTETIYYNDDNAWDYDRNKCCLGFGP